MTTQSQTINESVNTDIEAQLADEIASFTHDPLGYAYYAFPWGDGELDKSDGPRPWQMQILTDIRLHLENKDTRHQPCRIAVSSGHGIGKSALVGMLLSWAISTCEDCRITITAGTGTQLATKTVPEVGKWFRRAINAHWFDVNATSIRIKEPTRQATWRADFVTWSEHNTEAFAGMHNVGKRIVLVFDEASAIGDKVWEVAEGALTDEDTEIIWIAFGNPTKNEGRFRECFRKFRDMWQHRKIDARDVEGTNKKEIGKWAELWGEDSNFFKIRVRGEFPDASDRQFIPYSVVEECAKYRAQSYSALPKIFGVDVARFGEDKSVIFSRQGRKSQILAQYRGLRNDQLAERVIEWMQREKPQAVVVDGDGLGAGVIDHLYYRGFKAGIHEFHGNEKPRDPAMYKNRRAEAWGAMREWLQAGAEIPDDDDLKMDLTSPEYESKPAIILESKDDMRSRGVPSPDAGDALAMTFGVTVAPPPPKTIEYKPSFRSPSTSWMAQ